MYTNETAKSIHCILSKRLMPTFVEIYKDKLPKGVKFLDLDFCIGDNCDHWEFNKKKSHGRCGILKYLRDNIERINFMYKEEDAKQMSCILSKSMFDKIHKIYGGPPPEIPNIEFMDTEVCITRDCKHWKFETESEGQCTVGIKDFVLKQ